MRFIAISLLASLGLGACFDSVSSDSVSEPPPPPACNPATVAPPPVEVAWQLRELPPLSPFLTAMAELPPGHSPFERVPVLALGATPHWAGEGYGIVRVALLDQAGALLEVVENCPATTDERPGRCTTANPAFLLQPRPGDRLEVDLAWFSAPEGSACHTPLVETATTTLALGEDPEPGSQVPAVATFGDENDTVWLGTLHHGLVGIAPDGRAVLYPGVPINEPWSAEHQAPQTELLFDIEDAGDGALWIGGATTGISWFDPGPDLLSRDDDRWAHVQPRTSEDSPLKELAETTIAMAATPDGGLWVASLSGLHHAAADDTALRLETLTPGAYLAVATDADGTAWAGRSVEPAVLGKWQEEAADPWPDAALIEVQRNPAGEVTVRPWAVGTRAVTAVAVHGARVWLGTPTGLVTIRPDAPDAKPEPVLGDVFGGLAVTGIAPTPEGVWVAARSECATHRGELLRVGLDASGAPFVAQRLTDAGFATRDFNTVTHLASGELLVSTVVPSLGEVFGGPIVSARCTPPSAASRVGADVWRVDPSANPPAVRPIRPR